MLFAAQCGGALEFALVVESQQRVDEVRLHADRVELGAPVRIAAAVTRAAARKSLAIDLHVERKFTRENRTMYGN